MTPEEMVALAADALGRHGRDLPGGLGRFYADDEIMIRWLHRDRELSLFRMADQRQVLTERAGELIQTDTWVYWQLEPRLRALVRPRDGKARAGRK